MLPVQILQLFILSPIVAFRFFVLRQLDSRWAPAQTVYIVRNAEAGGDILWYRDEKNKGIDRNYGRM
jgi:hypothetical protein